jgi:hypothetical protein
MKKNFSMAIAGSIGIAIIIIIISLYNNQEPEITKIDEPIEIELENVVSEIPEIQEKYDEIKNKVDESGYYEVPPIEWITSGPFQIDRSEYIIGQKIFIRIGELDLDEKGQVAFMRPLNETHYSVYQTIPFDGTKKPAFNFYTQPSLSKYLKICTVDDLVGEWTVVFRGTSYPNLKFEVTNEILPGEEDAYVPVC